MELGTSELEALRDRLEHARRQRLQELGAAPDAIESSELKAFAAEAAPDVVRLMQFNLLADGMSNDGFLVQPVMDSWPTNITEVPTSGGDSVPLGQMLNEMMGAKGDEAALRTLKDAYDVPVAQANLELIVDWVARELQMQLLVLAAGRPDILVFQECDHFGSLIAAMAKLGYSSQLPGRTAPYTPAHLQGHDASEPSALERFREQFARMGHAFLPNLGSTSMQLQVIRSGLLPEIQRAAAAAGLGARFDEDSWGKLPRDAFRGCPGGSEKLLREAGLQDLASIDDDGIAVFWRVDRFRAESLDVHHLAGRRGKGIALEVRLRSCAGDQPLVVLGSHLSSGDKSADEERRLTGEVDAPDGLRAVLHRCMGADSSMPVVLALDANSHPQLRARDGASSVWRSLRSAAGASVWDAYFDDDGDYREDAPRSQKGSLSPAMSPPVSTNKVRGPCSDQARKIGEHAYHTIDHIFFNPVCLAMRGHVRPPTQFVSPEAALRQMLPSLENPSDHYPVVVDLAWSRVLRSLLPDKLSP